MRYHLTLSSNLKLQDNVIFESLNIPLTNPLDVKGELSIEVGYG